MLKRILVIFLLQAATCAWAASATYNYIAAKDLRNRINARSELIIIDICPAEQFAEGHVKGSIETNAYPVKTEAEKYRLAKQLPRIKDSRDDVVIVCPRGGGGAKRTVDYLNANGIDEKRLLILEKGMDKWPYETEQ